MMHVKCTPITFHSSAHATFTPCLPTPCITVQNGYEEAVRALYEMGADTLHADEFGASALYQVRFTCVELRNHYV